MWLVDAALAPVGLLAAAVAVVSPAAILGVFPLAAMIAALAQERSYRIEQEVEPARRTRASRCSSAKSSRTTTPTPASTAAASSSCPSRSRARSACATASSACVEFGALLHDVGKLQVPNEIINKAGPLDDAEWAIMRRHTIDGEAMLARSAA